MRSPDRAFMSATAAAATLLLSGCGSGEPTTNGPQAEAATAWLDLVCNARYAEANASIIEGARFTDEQSADGNADELLSQADALGEERLDDLRSQGVDVTPAIQIDDVTGAMTGISEVDASGSCFGEPFTLDDIMVGGPIDDAYVVTEDIPLVQQEDLFDVQSGWFKDANISIDTGMKFNGIEFPWEHGWLLPPGDHTIVIPANHYMIAEEQERTITVDPFGVGEPAEDVELSSAIVDETVEAFFAQCGDICSVTLPESQSDAVTPVEPVPIEIAADGSFTLARGDVAIIPPAPEVSAAGSVQWRELWPGDWSGDHTHDKGNAHDSVRPRTPLGVGLGSLCGGSESCTLNVDEVENAGVGLDAFYLDELDGDVHIVTLYGDDHLIPEEAPTDMPTDTPTDIEP